MPTFRVDTPLCSYPVMVERGAIGHLASHVPARAGKVFVLSNQDVLRLHGQAVEHGLGGRAHEVICLPPGENKKRFGPVEHAAEEMVRRGGDRSSLVVAFGGGIVNDMAGFLAAIFMRGIPVIQIPTTLLAQVDAAIGGKTGVNLECGKNLIGSFHQPVAVLIDPALLESLPEREYRAGLYEILKAGVIREPDLFRYLAEHSREVLSRQAEAVDRIIADAVRMKAEVVSGDEREADLRRILNFGHTFGHALESETGYTRFLHGEAVAWGMRAAVYLGQLCGYVSSEDAVDILELIEAYGPIPPLTGVSAENLLNRLVHDKKTVQGRIHFVLPIRIGEVTVISGVDEKLVREAVRSALN